MVQSKMMTVSPFIDLSTVARSTILLDVFISINIFQAL